MKRKYPRGLSMLMMSSILTIGEWLPEVRGQLPAREAGEGLMKSVWEGSSAAHSQLQGQNREKAGLLPRHRHRDGLTLTLSERRAHIWEGRGCFAVINSLPESQCERNVSHTRVSGFPRILYPILVTMPRERQQWSVFLMRTFL